MKNFGVIYEDAYSTKILFSGTKAQCSKFIKDNPDWCDEYVFIQELESEYECI